MFVGTDSPWTLAVALNSAYKILRLDCALSIILVRGLHDRQARVRVRPYALLSIELPA